MSSIRLSSDYDFSQGRVRFGIEGSGPSVVLVHGTPWSSWCWHRLIPQLTERYTVHFYDLIGYGQSEMRAGQNVSLAIQGQLLAELIDHWGLTSPRVIAHDFGGATSLRAHLLHGIEYTSLALIDVVALAPWGSPFFAHVREHEAAFAGVPAYIHRAIIEAYVRGAFHEQPAAEVLENLVAPWLSAQGQMAFYRQIAQADQQFTDEVEGQYSEIRCPVSIFWGDQDDWIPIETGRRLHEAIPHSTFTEVPGAGHLAQLERSDFVNTLITRFLVG